MSHQAHQIMYMWCHTSRRPAAELTSDYTPPFRLGVDKFNDIVLGHSVLVAIILFHVMRCALMQRMGLETVVPPQEIILILTVNLTHPHRPLHPKVYPKQSRRKHNKGDYK